MYKLPYGPASDEIKTGDELKFSFINPSGEKLNIFMKGESVLVEADSIKIASDIVQSISSYFAFKQLHSDCNFGEVKKIPQMFAEIQSLQDSLSRIDSDIAELGMVYYKLLKTAIN